MSIKGTIQHSECITLALHENREFVIPCFDEKQANSKRVSLYNARRELSENNQKLIQIQKFLDPTIGWCIKVKREEAKIFEVVNGELTAFQREVVISPANSRLIKEMLKENLPIEEITEICASRGLTKISVLTEIESIKDQPDDNEPAFPQDKLKREKLSLEDL